jgi:hypothetical protein
MGLSTNKDPLEASVESLLEGLGATESHVSTLSGVLPLLSHGERQFVALGVYLALELIRNDGRRSEGSGTLPRGREERG